MSYDLSISQCMAKIKNTQKRSAPQDEKGANNGAIVSPFCKWNKIEDSFTIK